MFCLSDGSSPQLNQRTNFIKVKFLLVEPSQKTNNQKASGLSKLLNVVLASLFLGANR